MAKVVWKYPVPVEDQFHIDMPEGAQVLTVQTQAGKPQIWALVDEENEPVHYGFRILGTGHKCHTEVGKYVGSFQLAGGSFIFHLFQL